VPLPAIEPFVLRQLLSTVPRYLRPEGPRPNPFLPWEPPLEVERFDTGHVVLLNKYPVQEAHLLLITDHWQPQAGWLRRQDWQAVARLSADTGGLWFFNSSARAGASQPHRHLQLLPRRSGEASCPLAGLFHDQLSGREPAPLWAHRLSRRGDPRGSTDLGALYTDHCRQLGLGEPHTDPQPRAPYNVLFDDDWFLTVRRVREHCAGFSINALGFAGYLICTAASDQDWLLRHGPWQLLQEVAAPVG
jgi:ATP adenylyltransferase